MFEVPYQLHERGSFQVAARLVGEGAAADERREVSLAVAGPIRALVIGHRRESALASALRLREVDVEFRDPAAFPKLEDLLQYHCVILDDVARKELPDSALEALETYVKKFGGGMLMTGGPRSFGDKAYQKSAVERILPVNLVEQQPKGKGRAPMGIFLVIDRSNSMGYNSRRHDVRDGEKMRYAREAALALVEQLRPEDRVGVIAFDSDPYVLGPLRPLVRAAGRCSRTASPGWCPGGGTDFKAALEIATAQLVQSGLKTLHIILMTDGDTNRGAGRSRGRDSGDGAPRNHRDYDSHRRRRRESRLSAADLPRHGRAVLSTSKTSRRYRSSSSTIRARRAARRRGKRSPARREDASSVGRRCGRWWATPRRSSAGWRIASSRPYARCR